jgi:hypothetical protein
VENRTFFNSYYDPPRYGSGYAASISSNRRTSPNAEKESAGA